jgi:hypothetical protein
LSLPRFDLDGRFRAASREGPTWLLERTLARKRQGLTLDVLAAAIGYAEESGSVVSRWESRGPACPERPLRAYLRGARVAADFLVNPPQTDQDRLDETVPLAVETACDGLASGGGGNPWRRRRATR